MCRIPGTWHDSSTVNITVEEFYQHRKEKRSWPWLLENRVSDCWITVLGTAEEPCHRLLNNRASDYWRIAPVTVEESCQRLLNNRARDCWTIVPVTVEQSCQPLLNNCASECWTIVPVTVEESCQPLLNNRASDCWRIVPVTVERPGQTFLKLVKGHFPSSNTFHDCSGTRTHNQLIRKRTLNHLAISV